MSSAIFETTSSKFAPNSSNGSCLAIASSNPANSSRGSCFLIASSRPANSSNGNCFAINASNPANSLKGICFLIASSNPANSSNGNCFAINSSNPANSSKGSCFLIASSNPANSSKGSCLAIASSNPANSSNGSAIFSLDPLNKFLNFDVNELNASENGLPKSDNSAGACELLDAVVKTPLNVVLRFLLMSETFKLAKGFCICSRFFVAIEGIDFGIESKLLEISLLILAKSKFIAGIGNDG